MPLQDFLQQRRQPTIQGGQAVGSLSSFLQQNRLPTTQSGQVTGSLSNFLQRGQQPIREIQPTVTPKVKPKEEKKSGFKDVFRGIGKQLMKPVGIVAKEVRGVGETLGHFMSIASPRISASEGLKAAAKSNIEAQKGALRVLIGREETTFLEEFKKAGVEPTQLDKVMGIGADFVLDPLWVTKPIKIAKKLGEVTRLAEPIRKITQAVKNAPPAQKLKMLFTNTTGNKEFDAIVKKFRTLKDYREANLIDDAVQLQKNIKKLGKGAEEIITEGLENPASLYKEIQQLAKIPKELEPLAVEARKYKSAEEFVKSLDEGKRGLFVEHAPTKRLLADIPENTSLSKFVPDEMMTVYRGVPSGVKTIKAGDFITTSSELAETYGVKVISKEVKVKNVYFDKSGFIADDFVKGLDDLHIEAVYNPKAPLTKSQLTDIYNQAVKGVEKAIPKVNQKIINIVETLKNTYKELLDESRKVGLKIGEIMDYAPHIRTKESFLNKLKVDLGIGAREFGKAGVEKGRKLKGTIKELGERGIDIFEKSPVIQLVKKGQAYAKAITSQEFANSVKQFAIKDGVEVTNPMLKDLKFLPEQAKVIDNFYQGIKPKELKVIIRSFDKIQNWWKAQALISPSYHIRNIGGNLWNNFLAGVTPEKYFQAGILQKRGVTAPIVEEMKKLGVINEGWYAKDIAEEVMNRVTKAGNWKAGINPLQQQNFAFQLNKKVGSAIENNARIAHYLTMKGKGMTPEKAAESVKKFLFDYGDLTSFEQNILKRVAPFYTWTRKNLPIQLEGIVTQPAKYALPHKIVELIESGVEVPNEKYMGEYITENIPVRVRKNKEGNTEYFLLGNWLPYASAIDILSHPIDTVIQMATPFLKTPIELWSNKSSFWKDTLGEYQDIERRFKQQGEFLGQSMRKKNILLLRNIRILNDVNKWVNKQDPTAVQNSYWVKALTTLFGKTATYDVGKSKFFYDMDTDDRITELKRAIKDAQKRGFKDKANELRNELTEFQQVRQGN